MGAQVGAVATKYIKGYGIRVAFGLAVIGCFISVFLKLLPNYVPSLNKICDVIATYMRPVEFPSIGYLLTRL